MEEERKIIYADNDIRPICSKDSPAPPSDRKYAYFPKWDSSYRHSDAMGRCINDDYDDWKYYCPHCKCVMIFEGPDA